MDGIIKIFKGFRLILLCTAILATLTPDGGKAMDLDASRHDRDSGVIRCLTPYIIGQDHHDRFLSHPETHDLSMEIREISTLSDTVEAHVYESESGRFRLIYTKEGPDSVWTIETGIGEPGVPDYIILAAQYADSSYRHQVEQLGYADPLNTSHCDTLAGLQIDIRFGDLRFGSSKVYGYFKEPDTSNVNSALYVHSTFDDPGFLNNDDDDLLGKIPNVLGALKVTIAHELKHAIQYATNCFGKIENNTNNMISPEQHWLEMDATMMENVVFPNVNDYYNYLGGTAGIFGNPQTPFPRAYSHVTFMLYYHEDLGEDFWVDVWDVIGQEHADGRNIPMLEAMNQVLEARRHLTDGPAAANLSAPDAASGPISVFGSDGLYAAGQSGTLAGDAIPDLEQSLLRNYLWHLASGKRSLDTYGFSERINYPDALFSGSFAAIPERPGASVSVMHHGARFFEYRADEMDAFGEVALALFNSENPLGIGFLGKTHHGDVVEILVKPEGSKRQKLVFPVNWEDLQWAGLVTMNITGESPLNNMELLAGEGPAIERLSYGDVTKTGELAVSDAQWILANSLNHASFSAFEYYLADVTGNGLVTHYDAARVLMHLDHHVRAPFPVDDNENGLGPEWSRFTVLDPYGMPVAAPAAAKAAGITAQSAPVQDDTVTATLRVLNDQVLAEQEMFLVLSVSGPSGIPDTAWNSIYLDLHIDFPPDDGGTQPGDPITLNLAGIDSGNDTPGLHGWEYELSGNRLRLAYASSVPLASQNHSNDVLTLRLIPENEGYIHFRIDGLQMDEWEYTVEHPPMGPIRVMGPVQADPNGNLDDLDDGKPIVFSLDQNYPNPFNPETVIRFSLPETGQVTLQVYDLTGRRIATLVDAHLERGHHRVRFDARDSAGISSGVYLYRLQAGGQALVRKMTVLR